MSMIETNRGWACWSVSLASAPSAPASRFAEHSPNAHRKLSYFSCSLFGRYRGDTMSWKASAYVKEITDNITPSEKLVLFVLADYHNTAQKAAWPSLIELAEHSLCTKPGLCRILARLEQAGFIQRVTGGGKGKRTQYRFPHLDGNGNSGLPLEQTQTVTEKAPNSNPNSNPSDIAIKEERCVTVEPLILSPPSAQPTNGNGHSKDARHADFRRKLERFWKYMNPEITLSWSAGEGGQLATFLKRWPKLTVEEFHCWLRNYSESDGIIETKTPREFLPYLHQYAKDPLDQFHKPLKDATK